VTEDMLSPYARSFPTIPKPAEKLVPNLMDKTKYVVHYTNLKLYLDLGMKLKRIHRILEFTQEAWLKPYVDHCTKMRQQSTSDFEKDFWKLCINAVFGKSMENVRNHVNVRLIHDPIVGIKAVSKPTFVCSKIINDDLVMVQMLIKQLRMNKPIYTGFCILELSKAFMYEFHYRHIVKRYGPDKARLLFTDTDSLCYLITTPNVYADMKEDLEVYDTSNFDKNHPSEIIRELYSTKYAKALGKFKVETGSKAPKEYVGLRPKMYSVLLGEDEIPKDDEEDERKLRAKGIKKSYTKKHIRHMDFVNTLNTRKSTTATFRTFASNNQQLQTLEINKVSLSAYDDKRYLREDGISSYAYGHKDIPRALSSSDGEPEAKRMCV